MNNAQRFIFSALVAVLALEFGSLTKFQKIWNMAFGLPVPKPADGPQEKTQSSTVSTTPKIHPV